MIAALAFVPIGFLLTVHFALVERSKARAGTRHRDAHIAARGRERVRGVSHGCISSLVHHRRVGRVIAADFDPVLVVP